MSKPISVYSKPYEVARFVDETIEQETNYQKRMVKVALNFCIPKEPEKTIEPERYTYNESPPPVWMLTKDKKEGRWK